jgi:hypothetical protein
MAAKKKNQFVLSSILLLQLSCGCLLHKIHFMPSESESLSILAEIPLSLEVVVVVVAIQTP